MALNIKSFTINQGECVTVEEGRVWFIQDIAGSTTGWQYEFATEGAYNLIEGVYLPGGTSIFANTASAADVSITYLDLEEGSYNVQPVEKILFTKRIIENLGSPFSQRRELSGVVLWPYATYLNGNAAIPPELMEEYDKPATLSVRWLKGGEFEDYPFPGYGATGYVDENGNPLISRRFTNEEIDDIDLTVKYSLEGSRDIVSNLGYRPTVGDPIVSASNISIPRLVKNQYEDVSFNLFSPNGITQLRAQYPTNTQITSAVGPDYVSSGEVTWRVQPVSQSYPFSGSGNRYDIDISRSNQFYFNTINSSGGSGDLQSYTIRYELDTEGFTAGDMTNYTVEIPLKLEESDPNPTATLSVPYTTGSSEVRAYVQYQSNSPTITSTVGDSSVDFTISLPNASSSFRYGPGRLWSRDLYIYDSNFFKRIRLNILITGNEIIT